MDIKNIFLITIDCLRADFIYELDKYKVHAPNFKRILEKSLYFPYAITNGPGTRFAFPAIMMSKLPGELDGIGLPLKEGKTIAEFFKEKGYITIGLSTNGWISRDFNYNRGFDFFYDPINWGRKEDKIKRKVIRILKDKNILFCMAKKGKDIISKFRRTFAFSYKFAEEANKKLLAVIKENNLYDKKMFIWIHYMDVHHPFCIRKEYVKFYPELKKISQNYALKVWRKTEYIKEMNKKDIDILISLYKMNISYIDHAIATLLKNFKHSLFIFTADHGEEFGEHGHFHRPTFYNEMLRIPLIIYGLNNKKGKNESLISHVDLGPFLTSLLNLDTDPSWSGKQEIDKIRYQFSAYKDFDRSGISIMDRDHKYISEHIGNNENKIYLLKRDSDELTHNKEKEEELKLQFNKVLEYISNSKIKISEAKMSEEIKQQLQNLGYL